MTSQLPSPRNRAQQWTAGVARRVAGTLATASGRRGRPADQRQARSTILVVLILVLAAGALALGVVSDAQSRNLEGQRVSSVDNEPTQPSTTSSRANPSRPTPSRPPRTTTPPATTQLAPPPVAPSPGAPAGLLVTGIVDGDTIDVEGGTRVRLIGIDTPEEGECGFEGASALLASMIAGRRVTLVPGARDNADRYGRLLRYVEVDGTDAGLTLLSAGLAIARYDGLDGYGRHPRQDLYRWTDASTPMSSGCPEPGSGSPPAAGPVPLFGGGGGGDATYFPNCSAAWAAGVAPLYAGSPGYRPGLDRDRDGVACEARP